MTAVSESRGPKSDKLDGFGVAERWRIGAIRRKVYQERGQSQRWAIERRRTGCWWAMRFG